MLAKKTSLGKRIRLTVLLFPFIILGFFIGFILYYGVRTKKRSNRNINKTVHSNDNISNLKGGE